MLVRNNTGNKETNLKCSTFFKSILSLNCILYYRYGAYQVMKKKFAKDKEIKQANLRQRMRELKKVSLVLRCRNKIKN
jgi:hypothetical protein